MHRSRAFLLVVALVSAVTGAQGQTASPGASPGPTIDRQLEQVRQQLAEARNGSLPVAPAAEELLLRRERVLMRLIDEGQRAAELAQGVPAQEPVKEGSTGLDDLEAMHAEIEASREATIALTTKVELGERLLDQAERRHQDVSGRSRQVRGGGDQAAALASLATEIAADQLRLVRSELDNDRTALAIERRRCVQLEDRREVVEERLRLDAGERERITGSLDAEAEELSGELDSARRAADAAASGVGSEPLNRLEAEAAERKVALISGRLDRLDTARSLWQQRLRLLAGQATRVEMATWLDEQRQLAAELDLVRRRGHVALSELVERRDALVSEEASAARDSRAELLATMLERERADLEHVEGLAAVHRRFLDELRRRQSAKPLETGAVDVLRAVRAVWTWEITTIDGRSLTVGKVVIALLVLVVGAFVARRLGRRIARRVLARVGIEAGAAAAFETLGFYLVMVILVVFALWVAEIPLTVFTLAGGALAIGIGFGSQNILANFISGLIILAERPIKVGDLIEVEQTFGEVERIGARSTTVKTSDNVHIIVPNSTFLESNVINWTHADNLVRIRLNLGVAYGSPTRAVERLLLEALSKHPKVLPDPAPVVLFEDFGDNALAFQAVFWIVMRRPMDRRGTLSDLRHSVDELFKNDGIVIAFPQRDVHLDTLSPLQVEVISKDV